MGNDASSININLNIFNGLPFKIQVRLYSTEDKAKEQSYMYQAVLDVGEYINSSAYFYSDTNTFYVSIKDYEQSYSLYSNNQMLYGDSYFIVPINLKNQSLNYTIVTGVSSTYNDVDYNFTEFTTDINHQSIRVFYPEDPDYKVQPYKTSLEDGDLLNNMDFQSFLNEKDPDGVFSPNIVDGYYLFGFGTLSQFPYNDSYDNGNYYHMNKLTPTFYTNNRDFVPPTFATSNPANINGVLSTIKQGFSTQEEKKLTRQRSIFLILIIIFLLLLSIMLFVFYKNHKNIKLIKQEYEK